MFQFCYNPEGGSVDKRPNLRAVAARAGVSVATASRALNTGRPVASATRERVLAAVKELGYAVDARSWRPRPMVGVIVPVMRHQVIAEIVAGVEEATSDAGRYCVCAVSHADPDRELAQLAAFVNDDRIGSVILAGGFQLTADYARRFMRITREFRDRGKPLVLSGRATTMERDLDVPGVVVLDYDNVGGASAAVGLLASRGHRTIALVRGPTGNTTSDARSAGYREALDHFGLPFDGGLVRTGDREASHGHAATISLLAERADVTAIFAESDELAMGVLQAAHSIGRPVPDTLSVVGFDDQHNAGYLVPALTTVHMPFAELGRRAARIALGEEAVRPGGARLLIGTHLIMRSSVASPGRR
ncbi:LacI family DNA-binding transcriptional regulator [Jiangella sp. DSM 45060]|uniref:LacI family DNA-binding transcriptional regulator n=1 Tax=Jiangella sp. DSM 45060 TaxID=1798224 RepID=UPI00087A9AFA|nr:LacI family DNA-binding transcriptional regulator [Jiangella sp. DSM 45060]SDS51017.1 LacI family transcriptional regulator [Jiangella sp. DSM 45060]